MYIACLLSISPYSGHWDMTNACPCGPYILVTGELHQLLLGGGLSNVEVTALHIMNANGRGPSWLTFWVTSLLR